MLLRFPKHHISIPKKHALALQFPLGSQAKIRRTNALADNIQASPAFLIAAPVAAAGWSFLHQPC
jgi:hypothetical protein